MVIRTNNSAHGMTQHRHRRSSSNSKKGILDTNGRLHAGRVAITAMSSFGSSAVVMSGVGGSVFLVYMINFGAHKSEFDSSCHGKSST